MSKILAELNHNNLGKAVDTIAQRIREVHLAKASGSSWEKAAVVSLLPAGLAANTTVPDNALAI